MNQSPSLELRMARTYLFPGTIIGEGALIKNPSSASVNCDDRHRFPHTIFPALLEAQDELFSCRDTMKKQELKETIEALKDELAKVQMQGASSEQWDRYLDARRQASKPFVLWQIDFARVFKEKGGFDVVIGNPPYIQLQKSINDETGEKLGDLYKDLGFETFAKTGDIYCLFYEKGYQLLREEGVLTFITSNKWMRAGYGKKLREFFATKTNPVRLIDFGSQKIFESATVDVNILMFLKGENEGRTLCCTVKEDCSDNLSVYIDHNSSISIFTNNDSWVLLSPIEQSIRKKMLSQGTPLSKWDLSINYGIKTGFNEAFIISSEKKDELIAEDPKSAEIIRPILRGRDIKRYNYTFADLWLIFVPWHFPLQDDESIKGVSDKAESLFQKQYPAIYKHLLSYKDALSKRNKAETGIRYEWYALQRWGAKYWNDFYEQSIAWKVLEKTFCC